MRDFILNIARRSAGLSAGVLVEPAPESVFLPGLSNQGRRIRSASLEEQSDGEVPGRLAMLIRHQEATEPEQDARQFGDEQSRRPIVDELRTEPKASNRALSTGYTERTEDEQQVSADPDSDSSHAIFSTSFAQRSTGWPLDPKVSDFQPTVEPQSLANLRDRGGKKTNFVEPLSDAPREAHEPSRTKLRTQTRPITRGNEEPVREGQSFGPSLQSSGSQFDSIRNASRDIPTTTIGSAATVERSGESLLGAHQQFGPAVTPLRPQIQVRIGTIEVRAEQAPVPRVAASQGPPSGFDDYNFIR
jgi:hypothetical protein